MPVAPPLHFDAPTTALDYVPYVSSLTETPAPSSRLSKSSFGLGASREREFVTLPEPGEEYCGFHIMEDLGQGTFARVYLATQDALAGRQVALKVSLKPTREPERLARLQHTNVVPVYSVHDKAPAQIICMPYLGRRTLADALTGFRKSHAAIAGLSTRKAIATKKGSSVTGSRTRTRIGDPAEAQPKSGSQIVAASPAGPLVGNVREILPLLLQLADGLAHAHERGVLHLDIKPANVLLADTGEPMLLDFNLSFAESEGKREVVGGTIPYMAPEQMHDLKHRGKGVVDARTDLYSLGVVAFELMAGKHPFPVSSRTLAEFDGLIAARMKGPPSLADVNPDVSPAVAAIVAKLLAPKPEDRYQTARELREDLDRQITDRPLKFAPDRSIAERVGKWRRRNPRMLVAFVLAAALTATGGAGAFAFNESEKRSQREAENRVRSTREGLAAVRLDLTLPDPTNRVRGMKDSQKLLGEFGLPRDPNWQSRAEFQYVPPELRSAVAGDLGELLLLVANARWEEGRIADRAGAANDARLLNELARGCFETPPPMLVRQRAALDSAAAPILTNSLTARDHYLDGVELFSQSKFDAAIRPLEKAISLQPDHGAAHFLLARCRQYMGQFDAAIEQYKSAAVILQNDARPSYFMGVSFGLISRFSDAEAAFDRAIEQNGKYSDAYLARGITHNELRNYADAERDYTTALEMGAPKLQVHSLRANARAALNDEVGAAADRDAAAKLKPELEGDFFTRGYTRMKSAPREAIADFQTVLKMNPASLSARRNLIQVLADELRDDAATVKAAGEMVEIFPEYAYGRAVRAISLARLGKREEAIREVEACRKLLTVKGPSYRDPNLVYRLALVYAITSKDAVGDGAVAIKILKEAMRTGFNDFAAMEKDRLRDLAAVWELPEFQTAVKAARELAN